MSEQMPEFQVTPMGRVFVPKSLRFPDLAENCLVKTGPDGVQLLFISERRAADPIATGQPEDREVVAHIWLNPERFVNMTAQFRFVTEYEGRRASPAPQTID